jgi:hypothetical protein
MSVRRQRAMYHQHAAMMYCWQYRWQRTVRLLRWGGVRVFVMEGCPLQLGLWLQA